MTDHPPPIASTVASSDAALIRLKRYGFLAVEGANSPQLLQGQFTCNVLEAGPDTVIPGAYCTPKGRAISSFLLYSAAPDRILLRMREDIIASTVSVLGKYAAFSKVRVGACTEGLEVFGLMGPDIGDRLERVLRCWPVGRHAVATPEDGVKLLRLDSAGTLAELWVERRAAHDLWERLTTVFDCRPESDWILALLRRGVAEIQTATRDLFIPQMLAYEHSGAINFRKGCYTGQEIIARTQYRGALKRHLRWGECVGSVVAAGADLRSAIDGRSVGVVVDAVDTPESTCELLAVIADDAADNDTTNIVTEDGRRLRLGPIPCDMI